jgi:phosphohistidine phosphatase SixA
VLKFFAAIAAAALLGAGAGQAQPLPSAALVLYLKHGGYVLLMRHAASPPDPPAKALAEPDNPGPERQLDATGKATARAMGEALRAMRIPVGRVESSPTYRALETARLAGLPTPETFAELGDGGASMQTLGEGQGAWLRHAVSQPPRPGTDTVIITHQPNIRAAYPDLAAGLADGEALVFRPGGEGGPRLEGRIKIEDWPALAQAKQ